MDDPAGQPGWAQRSRTRDSGGPHGRTLSREAPPVANRDSGEQPFLGMASAQQVVVVSDVV